MKGHQNTLVHVDKAWMIVVEDVCVSLFLLSATCSAARTVKREEAADGRKLSSSAEDGEAEAEFALTQIQTRASSLVKQGGEEG